MPARSSAATTRSNSATSGTGPMRTRYILRPAITSLRTKTLPRLSPRNFCAKRSALAGSENAPACMNRVGRVNPGAAGAAPDADAASGAALVAAIAGGTAGDVVAPGAAVGDTAADGAAAGGAAAGGVAASGMITRAAATGAAADVLAAAGVLDAVGVGDAAGEVDAAGMVDAVTTGGSGGTDGSMARTSTMAVPLRSMSSLAAAVYDRSMIRLPTNGPRSLTRTTMLRPFCKFVTRT